MVVGVEEEAPRFGVGDELQVVVVASYGDHVGRLIKCEIAVGDRISPGILSPSQSLSVSPVIRLAFGEKPRK